VVGSMSGAVTGDPPSSPSSIMISLALSVHVCCLVVRPTVSGTYKILLFCSCTLYTYLWKHLGHLVGTGTPRARAGLAL